MNLGQMLEESTKRFPDNIAFIHEKCRMTYAEFNRAANALGHYFRGLGIEKGDKIAIMLPNCPEFIISYFAAQKLGAVAVTMNVLSTPYELRHLIGDSDAKLFITQGVLAKRYEEIKNDLPLCKHLLATNGIDTDCPYTQAIKDNPSNWEMPDIAEDDPAVMIYTSGLTGRALGAVLTHGNLMTQAVMFTVTDFQGTPA